eukprot:2881204-Amphidinium_carterae.1
MAVRTVGLIIINLEGSAKHIHEERAGLDTFGIPDSSKECNTANIYPSKGDSLLVQRSFGASQEKPLKSVLTSRPDDSMVQRFACLFQSHPRAGGRIGGVYNWTKLGTRNGPFGAYGNLPRSERCMV